MIAVLSWSLAAAEPPAPPPPDNPVLDPANDRFVERDRRARGAYRVALAIGAVGVALEVVGGVTDNRDIYALGGTMEAVAAPSMAFSSLASAQALGRLTDRPLPAFAWTASGLAGADLVLSLTAASNTDQLTNLQRRRLVPLIVTSRVLTVLGACCSSAPTIGFAVGSGCGSDTAARPGARAWHSRRSSGGSRRVSC